MPNLVVSPSREHTSLPPIYGRAFVPEFGRAESVPTITVGLQASPTAVQERRGVRIHRRPEYLPTLGNVGPFVERTKPKTAPEQTEQAGYSFKALESWVGKVTEVNLEARSFVALVVSDQQNVQEQAEFTFDEISEDDVNLVQLGAIFYWSVGYQVNGYGGRSTSSVIRFRRLHHWRPREIAAAKARAASYADWFLSGVTGGVGNTSQSK